MSLPPIRKSWIIPALITILIYIGQLAGNYLLEDSLQEWRWLLWTLMILAGILTVVLAVQASRESDKVDRIDRRTIGKQYNEQRERYLQQISNERKDLSLSLFDPRSANPNTAAQRKLQMADVYIALDTKECVEEETESKSGEGRVMARNEKPLSALHAAVKYPHLLLLGEPGGGKSTFVNHLVFCLAMNKLELRNPLWAEKLGDLPRQPILPWPSLFKRVAR